MSLIENYNPLQWPPNIKLAELHYNCSKPGIDNPEGAKCPCCDRFEKLQNSQWPRRDIAKDFKNYGGGIPGYFYLITYFVTFLLILTFVKVIYHILMLQTICPHLQDDLENRCTGIFGIFKFCSAEILYRQSVNFGYQKQAEVLQYLNLATYIILVGATIGIKIFLQYLNKDKISLDEKLFSKFSLIIKNVPLYYQLQDLKEEFKVIDPKTQINEMFYLHKYCKFQKQYRQIFDLYFKIVHLEQQTLTDDRQKKIKVLRQQYHKYIELFDHVKDPSQIKNNSKKILVVFNTIEQKEHIHEHLRMNGLVKFSHYFFRLFKSKIEPIGYYSERLTEPQEVLWKNIGESSTKKQKVRIQTTIIGVGFMILTFAVLYFPMYWVDEQKVNKPGLGTGLGTAISIIIIILAVVYRMIIVRLMPTRRPSSKLAQAFFIILTTIVFHFFFYVVTPATFYIFAKSIRPNDKLKEFFSAVFLFSLMVLLVAALDLKYRFFNKKKEKLLGQASQSNNYCQQRLHQELTPPSFPIQFKLMVIFNIWTFNSFYIFEIPYLIFLFMIILGILFWIDKKNLYRHYKTQQYISIELEIKVQKTYIIFFLICVSGGFYLTSVFLWERITIGVIFVLAIIINFALNLSYKKHKDSILRHNTNLKHAIQQSKQSFAMITHINMMQQDLKNSFLAPPDINAFSSVSLASELMSYGYLETYKLFKLQFKNKTFNQMLNNKYLTIRKAKSILSQHKVKQNQLPKYAQGNIDLNQNLIQQRVGQNEIQTQIKIKEPVLLQQQQIQIKWQQQKIEPIKNQNPPLVQLQIQSKPQIDINAIKNGEQKIVQQLQQVILVPQIIYNTGPEPEQKEDIPTDK